MFKGLHRVTKRLADGSRKQYIYAWRGGPLIRAAYGTDEFAAEYERAIQAARRPPQRRRVVPVFRDVKNERQAATKLVQNARLRAKLKGFECSVTVDDVQQKIAAQSFRCAVTGLPFVLNHLGKTATNPYNPSLDRIDNEKGYTPGNTRVVLVAVNTALNVWGLEVFMQIARAAVDHQSTLPAPLSIGRMGE